MSTSLHTIFHNLAVSQNVSDLAEIHWSPNRSGIDLKWESKHSGVITSGTLYKTITSYLQVVQQQTPEKLVLFNINADKITYAFEGNYSLTEATKQTIFKTIFEHLQQTAPQIANNLEDISKVQFSFREQELSLYIAVEDTDQLIELTANNSRYHVTQLSNREVLLLELGNTSLLEELHSDYFSEISTEEEFCIYDTNKSIQLKFSASITFTEDSSPEITTTRLIKQN